MVDGLSYPLSTSNHYQTETGISMKLSPRTGGLLIALLLLVAQLFLGLFSYWGTGVQVVNAATAQQLRAASLGGPRVVGGGPGSGK